MFNQTQSSDLETENNYTSTQRWGGWREKTNKPSKIKTKKAKKSSVFKSCDFSCRSKGRLDCDQTREKCTQRLFEHFLFWSQIVFAWVRVFPNPDIYLQQIPGKKEKKKRGTGSFLGTHKGDKPLKFLSKSICYISLLLSDKHCESKEISFTRWIAWTYRQIMRAELWTSP